MIYKCRGSRSKLVVLKLNTPAGQGKWKYTQDLEINNNNNKLFLI